MVLIDFDQTVQIMSPYVIATAGTDSKMMWRIIEWLIYILQFFYSIYPTHIFENSNSQRSTHSRNHVSTNKQQQQPSQQPGQFLCIFLYSPVSLDFKPPS